MDVFHGGECFCDSAANALVKRCCICICINIKIILCQGMFSKGKSCINVVTKGLCMRRVCRRRAFTPTRARAYVFVYAGRADNCQEH